MFVLDINVVTELRKAESGRADPKVVAWASAQAGGLFTSPPSPSSSSSSEF